MPNARLDSAILCSFLSVNMVLAASNSQDKPLPMKVPHIVPQREPVDRTQRLGSPVFIRATRSIKITTEEAHQSKKNIVAVYMGLPVVDAGQDKVVIEKVLSKRAKPDNLAFSSDGGTLLVEYIDVAPGFEDEIQVSFSLEIYERKARMTGVKPYRTESDTFKKYARMPFFHGHKPRPGDDKYWSFLYDAGVSPDTDPFVRAKAVYDFVHQELAYGRTCGKFGDHKPNCATYTAYFAILCGQAGVPARRCAGFAFGSPPDNPQATNVSGHNWAEFYVEGIGWIPVDPTMGDKTDARKQYYLGSVDNGRLCVSKWGFNDRLPLRYKNQDNQKWVFTANATDFKPFKNPRAIQGIHLFQYALDEMPVKIKTSDPYGPSLTITERKGNISKSLNREDLTNESMDDQNANTVDTP